MTNPFAPQAPQTVNAVAPQNQIGYVPTPAQPFATPQTHPQGFAPPAPQGGGGIDDPALFQGFGEPLFPHIDGLFGFELVGFSVKPARSQGGYTSEASVETTVLVHQSTNAAAPVGSKWRFSYKFDWERNMPTVGSQGPVHAKLLASLLRAAGNSPASIKGFGDQLRTTDFATSAQKYYVKLNSELKPVTVTDPKTKAQSVQNRRREAWLPAA